MTLLVLCTAVYNWAALGAPSKWTHARDRHLRHVVRLSKRTTFCPVSLELVTL